jgi:hypothetical protein
MWSSEELFLIILWRRKSWIYLPVDSWITEDPTSLKFREAMNKTLNKFQGWIICTCSTLTQKRHA